MERLTDDARFTYYYPFWLTLLARAICCSARSRTR